uniref:NADH-ubiquinone oxidoreductase chain 3 n=1 Tax=Phatnoma laciniatum TaxID=1964415 RepID=A0A343BT97_9HEMI|nr:NADH dehydrogenase subunit 3 [Phatnoma laciniatum]ARB50162.1 NADH dehydrogenase subunit 3 [Phatnoma laciniatum]
MLKVMYIMMLMILMSTTLLTVNMMISKKSNHEREKMTPFECGFNPNKSARKPFSIQFFLLGILFLVFDVEVTLILPLIITIKNSTLVIWSVSTNTILIILTLGLFHEWKSSTLDWIN